MICVIALGCVDGALYYAARMLHGGARRCSSTLARISAELAASPLRLAGEEPRYVTRRLIRFASEDVGNADPGALPLATSAFLAVERRNHVKKILRREQPPLLRTIPACEAAVGLLRQVTEQVTVPGLVGRQGAAVLKLRCGGRQGYGGSFPIASTSASQLTSA